MDFDVLASTPSRKLQHAEGTGLLPDDTVRVAVKRPAADQPWAVAQGASSSGSGQPLSHDSGKMSGGAGRSPLLQSKGRQMLQTAAEFAADVRDVLATRLKVGVV